MYEFKTSPVFEANYEATEGIVVNQGGTDSSKTYSILQVLATIATTTVAPSEDPIITIVSKSVPNMKKGTWRTMQSIIATPSFNRYIKQVHEGDHIIKFVTGWVMEFVGVTNEQNAKGPKRQYLFVNEADGIPWNIFWQFAKRARVRIFIDYNPSAPFWAHDKLIGTTKNGNDLGLDVKMIISDHRHNPFLSEQDHWRTESIKDKNLFDVYARGKTGSLTGLIYPDWKMIDDSDYPWDEARKVGGLDFGYTNDPTAGVRITRIGNKLYVHELCYQAGMTPTQLKTLFKSVGFKQETPIYCDHDGDMIKQLRLLNLYAVPASKKIIPGIHKVNEYEVFYTASSKNIDIERKRYMWLKDKVTDKPINEPIDQFNHCMDAIRYGVYTHFYRET